MTTTLSEIREAITLLSGSGKRVASTRRHGLYTTFTLPGLTDMSGVRDTARRFADHGVPNDLSGKTWLDLGANVGACAFEAARRGATVVGVEYREDRCALMRVIAEFFSQYQECLDVGLWGPLWRNNDSCTPTPQFYQADLNEHSFDLELGLVFPWYRRHDIVWCSSVDEYIRDLEPFYDMIADLCGETLYLESNLQAKGLSDPDNMIGILERHGFVDIEYLGNGHSGGISRKRKLYRAKAGRK